jgi:hypothetical protein
VDGSPTIHHPLIAQRQRLPEGSTTKPGPATVVSPDMENNGLESAMNELHRSSIRNPNAEREPPFKNR